MMKNKIYNYIGLAGLLILFAGCNDWLEDVEPPTAVPGEVVVSTADGVNSLRASMYSQLRKFQFSTNYFVGPSAFTDETRARTGATRMVDLNQAVGTIGTVHLSSYTHAYSIIQDANIMIHAIEEGVLDPDTEARYKGEAHVIRALAMHHLVRALGYEPGTQGAQEWDLGIIIRTTPTIDVEDADLRPRATVEEVYDQILSDLDEAESLLEGHNADNTRFTQAFAVGLRARVNLYARNWADARDDAQQAITLSGLSLQDTAEDVAGMFHESVGGHPEALFKLVVHPTQEPIGVDNNYVGANVNDGLAVYTSTQWVAQVPTQFVLDLYDEDDYRLGSFVRDADTDTIMVDPVTGVRLYEGGWYQPCFNSQQNVPVSGCTDVNDAGLSTAKWNGDKGNMADDIPYMRVSELYLIWAEAAARAGLPADGLGPLQTLRDARNAGSVPAEALLSAQAFEDEILNERVRELVVEGHRFWDLKRLERDVRHPDGEIKMRADSYRILAQIGPALRSVNPLLEENPGY